jgi:hypothetical protein
VRGAAADGVNATAIDVAGIIKMAEKFKRLFWAERYPAGGKIDWKGMCFSLDISSRVFLLYI